MITRIAGLALVAAITAFLLRGFGWKGAPVFISMAFVGIISLAAPYLSEVFGFIKSSASVYGIESSVTAVAKVVGIGYLTGITADVCRELEAGAVSGAVVLVGRIEIIAVVLPFFGEIMRLGGELLS